jgi:hypothetical protein
VKRTIREANEVSELVIQFGSSSAIDWTGTERGGKDWYRFEREPSVVFLVKPSFRSNNGVIRNVTNEGVTLAVSERLSPGSRLAIFMPTIDYLLPEFRVVEVCHFFPSLGGWLHGCRFLRDVASDELLAWAETLIPEDAVTETANAG